MFEDVVNRRGGQAAMLGGALFAGLFGLLALGESGTVPQLGFLETHWLLHILQAVPYALLVIGILALCRAQGERLGKLGKVCRGIALWGFSVGVAAAVIIPFVELGLGIETDQGKLDILVHLPEFLPYMIGSLLLAIAFLRAGRLPRGRAILFLVAVILVLVTTFSGVSTHLVRTPPVLLYGLAWAALGQSLIEREAALPAVVLAA